MTIGGPVASAIPSAPDAERDLILRVQRGETEAFEELVRTYMRRARAIARRLMRDPDDADDLVQDAFLRALQRIDRFDLGRPFGPWFFRLLVNLGLDQHRRRRGTRVELDDVTLVSTELAPDRNALGAEIRERLATALEQLPPRQRLVVWEFEVEGREVSEIAETLGITAVTVRWHLSEGRRALRTKLGDLLP